MDKWSTRPIAIVQPKTFACAFVINAVPFELYTREIFADHIEDADRILSIRWFIGRYHVRSC